MLESSGGEGLGRRELKDGSGFESEKTSAKWQFRSSHFEAVDSAVIEPFESITGMRCRLGSKEW